MNDYDLIRKNPRVYIEEWMEKNLIHVGAKVFKIVSLLPCSLILPDIPFSSTNIRANFNLLYISNPSTGKSTACKKFSEITYNPYMIRKVSSAKLREDLSNLKIFSMIIEDFSEIGESADKYDTIKVIESALGDERVIKKKTMREEIDAITHGVGLICGTWTDLGRYFEYFKSGLFFRFVFLFIDLSDEELRDIGRYINNGIGNKDLSVDSIAKEKIVKEFYEELYDIQSGEHKDFKDKFQVKSYYFDEAIKEKIYSAWDKKIRRAKTHFMDKFKHKLEYSFSRELQEAYRFLVSHAFLNYHSRKIEDHVLYPNSEDCDFAVAQMLENLDNKLDILMSRAFISMVGMNDLRGALESQIPQKTKKILMNLSNYKFK